MDPTRTTGSELIVETAVRLDVHGHGVLDEATCLKLLRNEHLGRLGLSIGALPVVVPVNYLLDRRSILFRSEAGGTVAAARAGAVACLVIDRFDGFETPGWSVNATGRLRVLEADEVNVFDGISMIARAHDDDTDIIELSIELISGRTNGSSELQSLTKTIAGHPLSATDHAGMEILTHGECLELLKLATIGRVAFIHEGRPMILPVTLGWWDESIVFATGRGSKLGAAMALESVAVEIDGWDAGSQSGWSVIINGTARLVEDGREVSSLDRLSVESWLRPEVPKHWIRITTDEMSGRRLPSR